MELNRTVEALQFYFKGILHLSLEIQKDRTPKVISVISSNLGIFSIYCSVLILQSLWFLFEHLKILCCKQFVYQKLVMVHYHQTCIFHGPQAYHIKLQSKFQQDLALCLLHSSCYRITGVFVTPFFFQSKVLVWTCIGLNSKTRRFWQLAELQKQPCTSTN
jgi:hypothetical protein